MATPLIRFRSLIHRTMQLYKTVSERGKFTRMFTEAQHLYAMGDVDSSFLMYSLLAELGFEEAQTNVAYLLERGMQL